MRLLLTICLLLISQSVFSKGGDEVRNGGGLAENYLTYAFENIDKSIDLCLAQVTCVQTSEERNILIQIKNSLPQEIAGNIVQFSTEQKKPGYFMVDGYVRLAVTGDNVGDTIYYNLDLLYRGNEVNMSYGQAVQSLIHELAHHHKIKNHNQLELLGARVRSAIEGSVNDVSYLPYLKNQGFFAIGTENKSFEKNGSLFLIFQEKIIDLTPNFQGLLSKCDSDATSAEPLKSSAVQFFNLHWNLGSLTNPNQEKTLSGNVVVYCQHLYLKQYRKFYEFKIGVKVSFTNAYEYKKSRIIGSPVYMFTLLKNSIVGF